LTCSILSRVLADDHVYQGRAGLLHGLFDCRFNGIRLFDSLAETDAVAKLLIEKGVITKDEFMEKIKAERATYQAMLQKL